MTMFESTWVTIPVLTLSRTNIHYYQWIGVALLSLSIESSKYFAILVFVFITHQTIACATILEYCFPTTSRHWNIFVFSCVKAVEQACSWTIWFGKFFTSKNWKSLLNVIAYNNIVPVRLVGVNAWMKPLLMILSRKLKFLEVVESLINSSV